MNVNPINLIPSDELGKDSKIKLSICDTEHDLYWRMAIEVLETIKANNEKGEDTITQGRNFYFTQLCYN